MSFQPRRHCRALVPCVIFLVLLLAAPAWAAEKTRLRGRIISTQPQTHRQGEGKVHRVGGSEHCIF